MGGALVKSAIGEYYFRVEITGAGPLLVIIVQSPRN